MGAKFTARAAVLGLMMATTTLVSDSGGTDAAASQTDPVLATGSVVGAESASIEARIWPNQETLDQIAPGESVPFFKVNDVTVSQDEFTLHLDPEEVPAAYRGPDGVDLEVLSHSGSGGGSQSRTGSEADGHNQSFRFEEGRWVPAEWHAPKNTDAAESSKSPDKPISLRVGDQDLPAQELRVDTSTSQDQSTAQRSEPICSVNKTNTVYQKRAVIGAVLPNRNYMDGRITYTGGSDHALGVAIKPYNGSIQAGGTITRSSSSSHSFVPGYRRAYHSARTDWWYRNYKNSCTQRISARPERQAGGYYRAKLNDKHYNNCKPYPYGRWTRHERTAHTYRRGVVFQGVGVNTKVGYSWSARLQYRLKRRGYLCGNDAYPGYAGLVSGR